MREKRRGTVSRKGREGQGSWREGLSSRGSVGEGKTDSVVTRPSEKVVAVFRSNPGIASDYTTLALPDNRSKQSPSYSLLPGRRLVGGGGWGRGVNSNGATTQNTYFLSCYLNDNPT